ncbi:MAG: 5-(carboxyamino)imidazole ribonucleotide mutase [Bdellovibrionales bacterium]
MAKKLDVAVIMGSTSDLKVMKPGIDCLKKWKVPTEVQIVSAHRTPDFMKKYTEKARKRGCKIIIAGAGGSAHLPGMTASFTSLPVIGVPVKTKSLKGLDSLLSIVQMPKDIPVATVSIDNSYNAALLAIRILALQDKSLHSKLEQYKKKQKKRVLKSNRSLSKLL